MQQSKSVLAREWAAIYTSKESKFIMVGNVQSYKYRLQGSHVIAFNRTYPTPKETALSQRAVKNKAVFLGFESNLPNFTNITGKEVLFHVNLDQEEIITKQNVAIHLIQTYKITENFFEKDGEQDEIQGHAHPVLINSTPLCSNHSLLVMYPDQELPQIIGQDIVLLLLNFFKLFSNLKIGYSSLGAGVTHNHLHFHLFFGQDIVGGPLLPLQHQKSILWKKTSLVNPSQQINLYSVGIQIQQFDGSIGQGFILSPIGHQLQPSQVASSLSFVFGIIANELIQLCIPHNILFTACGNKIYIVLRQFAHQKANYGFFEYFGIVPVNTEQNYAIREEQILKNKKMLRVEQKLIEALKKNVAHNLSTFI